MFSTKQLAQTNTNFMSRVYFWMMIGLIISGGVAYTVAHSPSIMATLFNNRFLFLLMIMAQFIAVIGLSAMINRLSASAATLIYLGYAALSGLTFSVVLMVYTQQSIAEAFFITAFAFVGLSAFGFLTKRDLGPLGTFCMTGLFGLIGFMLITWLFPAMRTTAISQSISFLAILIFSGLTAYDTQKLKNFNMQGLSVGQEQKAAITGALMLYLDFINIFISLLNLFGNRR